MMLPHWFLASVLISVTAGPISHHAIWVHGEWDGVFHKLVPWIGLSQVLEFFLLRWLDQGVFQSLLILSVLALGYAASLFSSIAIYRLLLHPTRSFPGPFWAKLSSWWRVRAFLNHNEQAYAVTHELHQKYGDIVRVGITTALQLVLMYSVPLTPMQALDFSLSTMWTRSPQSTDPVLSVSNLPTI
jgi:hypothetical protein